MASKYFHKHIMKGYQCVASGKNWYIYVKGRLPMKIHHCTLMVNGNITWQSEEFKWWEFLDQCEERFPKLLQ